MATRHQLVVEGMHCVSCVAFLEELLSTYNLEDVHVSLFAGTVSFSHAAGLDLKPILRELEDAGFKAVLPDKHAAPGETAAHPHSSKPLRWLDQVRPAKRQQRKKHKEVCEACRAEEAGEALLGDTKSHSHPVSEPMPARWMQSTYNIDGMTCGSCVSSIKTGLEQDDAIRSVTVTLIPARAVVEHDVSRTDPYEIKEQIDDLGYEATLETTVALDTGEKPKWHAKLSVSGMTCASCTGSVKQALKNIEGANDISVDLTSGLCTLTLSEKNDAGLASEEVKDAGFECEVVDVNLVGGEKPAAAQQNARTVRMQIEGMFCHECVGKVNHRLEQLSQQHAGLSLSPVTLDSPFVLVAYGPGSALKLRGLRQHIWELGFGFVPAPFDSIEQRAARARAKEGRYILIRLLIALTLAVPAFVIAVIGMSLLPKDNDFRMWLMEPIWGMASRGEVALWALATPVQFGVGAFFYIRSYKSLRAVWRRRRSTASWQSVVILRLFRWGSMDSLVALGTSLAYFSSIAFLALDVTSKDDAAGEMGYFDTSIFLIFFILAGRYLEAAAKQRTGDAISELNKSKAQTGLLFTSGTTEQGSSTEEVETAFLELGDVLMVPAGATPALDGVLIDNSAATSFDESAMTGEARPVLKKPGDAVYAGTINRGPAAALVRVTATAGRSMVDGIASAVQDAMSSKASIERIADTVTAFFVPAIVAIACFTFAVWLVRGYAGDLPERWLGQDDRGGWALFALKFAVAVLVVACPCGIGLAAPTAQLVGVGLAAKNGILPNGGGEAFQAFMNVSSLVIDKTGTLTTSDFKVSDVELLVETDEQRHLLWSIASVIEAASSHPLSVGLRKRCEAEIGHHAVNVELAQTEEIAGRGLSAIISVGTSKERFEVLIGNEALMRDRHAEYASADQESASGDSIRSWQSGAKSVILLAVRRLQQSSSDLPLESDGFKILALFGLHDPPRPEAAAVIAELKRRGITTWMCTGDNEATARAVAAGVGIEPDHVVAHALPDDKRDLVKKLQTAADGKRTHVAFCGDGINDSPALAQADAGIAMGGGSAVALKAAHFTLVGSSLLGLITVRQLSRSTIRKIYSNFAWACLYNVVLIPLAAGAFYQLGQTKLPAVWASLAMALSSVSVVVNSLLLRVFFRLPKMVRDWQIRA